MSLASLLLLNLAVIAVIAGIAWLISLPLRDASIMDVFWGLGFVAIAWTSVIACGSEARGWLVAILITTWGLRLAAYLAWRKWRQPEDPRYAALRTAYGERYWLISVVVIFGLQAVLIWIISIPLVFATIAPGPLKWLDHVGAGVWLVGFLFESVGDLQLALFKANPANRGQVCDRGLWRYTRHPNYFGDFLVWWGIFLIALAGGAPWWMGLSPLLMSLLLLRVSGVTLLEKSLAQRTAGYRDYVSRTSPFFPWPPRR